jgi:hypothetical protein
VGKKPAIHVLWHSDHVDCAAEFERQARLSAAGAPDQRVNRDVSRVLEPRLQLGEYVRARHKRYLAGIGDKQVELAWRFALARPATPVGRGKLFAPQQHPNIGDLGSNVSYNVKKMVANKYLAHERSVHDRRSIHVRLTEKGINRETA